MKRARIQVAAVCRSVVTAVACAAEPSAKETMDTTCGKARVPSPVWASSLYARRGDRWVNVLHQHTPVAPG